MVCDICGKTLYWCLGHAPYRFETPYRPEVRSAWQGRALRPRAVGTAVQEESNG